MPPLAKAVRALTIGHSDRAFEAFAALLEAHGARVVVDVRRFPASRRVPWTAAQRLAPALAARGIGYQHVPELGGLRKPRGDSVNDAWRNASFRAYADHMGSDEFARGLAVVLDLAQETLPALMCAEAVPWRCHRNLVADALVAHGVEVAHVMDGGLHEHRLPEFARVDGQDVTYPAPGGRQARLPGA